jgi:hypothetical protein
MVTDTPPRKADLDTFRESDRITTRDIPNSALLPEFANAIESAMKAQQTPKVRTACAGFLKAGSQFYDVPECAVRVLASRPLRVREHWTTELFGDYAPDSKVILDADSSARGDHIFRHVSEHLMSRVLPSSRFSEVWVC